MEQNSDLDKFRSLVDIVSCNSSIYNFSQDTAMDMIQGYVKSMMTIHLPATITLLCLYVPVFLISLVGNMLVIYVVCKNRAMRRVTNMFLVNLAVADLFVTLICVPVVAGQMVFRIWAYGTFMCKLTGFMEGVAIACSIFTLTTLSIDRYIAIKAPMSLEKMTNKCLALKVLTVIWIMAALLVGPSLYIRRVRTITFTCFDITVSYCIEDWATESDRKAYSIVLLVIICIIPSLVIGMCYSLIGKALCSDEFHRKISDGSATGMMGRKRVARMLIVLICIFMICWLPYNLCSLIVDLRLNYNGARVLPFTMWLAHAHSAVNPIVYWSMNKSFRHCMRKTLLCRVTRFSQRDSPYG